MTIAINFMCCSAGVNAIMAKIGSCAKPTVTITVDGDNWTIKSDALLKSSFISFTLNKEFDETTADDRKMKVVYLGILKDLFELLAARDTDSGRWQIFIHPPSRDRLLI